MFKLRCHIDSCPTKFVSHQMHSDIIQCPPVCNSIGSTPDAIRYYGKSFCKPSFQLRMALKNGQNKAEMKERKKTTLRLLGVFADVE